jgi:hypothetical protein
MTVYLALRKTPPEGVAQKAFFYLTRWRLLTRYPHAGVVCEGILYQSTFAKGVHSDAFDPTGWHLFPTNVPHETIINRFNDVNHSRYDWFSLLAFVLPFKMTVGQWWYCYELAHYLLSGLKPTGRVTPEDLLAGVAHEEGRN